MSDHLLTILLVIPFATGIGILFLPSNAKRAMYTVAMIMSLLGFFLSLKLLGGDYSTGQFLFTEKYRWIPQFGISWFMGVDGISLWLVILTTILLPIVILASWSYIKDRVREYLFSLFLLQTSMLGAFFALDLFLFFIFWELMLIPMYLIIGVWGGERRIYATVKFFIFTMVGSALMFVAILFLVSQYKALAGEPTFNYLALRRVILPASMQMWLFLAFALSFAIKVPLWPLHTWLPDAHTEAPTGGSVILAGVLLKMGTYGFLRFAMPLFPNASHEAGPTLAILAIIGIIFGSLVAWMQKDVKKLVAYSSVAHLGFCMLGLFALETRSVAGSVYQMLNHGVSTGMLFLLVGVIYERRHTRLISEFGGLAKIMPAYAALFVIVTLSSVGLPTTNGFVGEFLILWGTFKSSVLPHSRWMAVFAATGVVLGAVYMLSVVLRVFFGSLKNPRNRDLQDLNAREWLYLAPGIVLIFVMGLFPTPFLQRIEPSVQRMIDDYKQKGNMTLQIEEPMLSKPLTELLPPEKLAWSIGPMSKPQIPVVAGSGGQPPRGTAMQVGPRAPRGVRGKQAGKFQPNLPRPPQHVGEAKGGKLKLDVPERPVPKTKVPKQPPPPVKSPKGGAS